RHLVGDREERVLEDLEGNGVHAGARCGAENRRVAHGSPPEVSRMFPPSSSAARQPGGTRPVASYSASEGGLAPLPNLPPAGMGRARPARGALRSGGWVWERGVAPPRTAAQPPGVRKMFPPSSRAARQPGGTRPVAS